MVLLLQQTLPDPELIPQRITFVELHCVQSWVVTLRLREITQE